MKQRSAGLINSENSCMCAFALRFQKWKKKKKKSKEEKKKNKKPNNSFAV